MNKKRKPKKKKSNKHQIRKQLLEDGIEFKIYVQGSYEDGVYACNLDRYTPEDGERFRTIGQAAEYVIKDELAELTMEIE